MLGDDPDAPAASPPSPPRRMPDIIVVEQRQINFGQDLKFENDPFRVKLNGLMKGEDYMSAITAINDALKVCRATNTDHALLAMGPMMLPLIAWSIRYKQHRSQRRKIMDQCVADFNRSYPDLYMRWQTRPEKRLTIMKRIDAEKQMNQ